ncbi:MAG: ferrochelatase [Ignavibacteriales bacterium]|nr:ferrochelatase [Ignavibacteriales bacterium]
MKNIAVVLFNLGGPDSLEAVQPFLENLFNDPDIFKLPFQKQLARFISKKRSPKVEKQYALIGGKSPLGEWTEIQRSGLEKRLREANPSLNFDVLVAMRYWKPLTQETVAQLAKKQYDQIILLPLYPHFSVSTTGSSYNEFMRFYTGNTSIVSLIKNYETHSQYVRALNERIEDGLHKFAPEERPQVQFVFSAHGTPVSYVKKGDPYSHQIKLTVNAVMLLRNYSHGYHLCFQSKVGPAKWLEPATENMIKELARAGKKLLLIIPVSFVSDHVETLFELDIEYRHVAEACGINKYIVMPGLNDSQLFIGALAELVIGKLQ